MSKLSETVLAELGHSREWEKTTMFRGWTVATLRNIFDAIEVPGNWKAGFTRRMSPGVVPIATAAVVFFHGAEPTVSEVQATGDVLFTSPGYAC